MSQPIQPEQQHRQICPTREVGPKSKVAMHGMSNGPLLPESYLSFSFMIFIFKDRLWDKARFNHESLQQRPLQKELEK